MITIDLPSTASTPAESFDSLSNDSLSKPALTRFLTRARAAVGLHGQVDVLLSSDAELKRLNRAFRGKNKATDVLSFPTPPEIAQTHAGDLAISLDTAARQAAAFGHTLQDEVRILLLHGLLHLHGEDHETDQGQMAAREAQLRLQLKLPINLIERVTQPKAKPKAKSKPKPKPKPRAKP